MLLLEGNFTDEADVELQLLNDMPVLNDKETLLKTWHISSSELGSNVRLLLTDTTDTEHLKLYVRDSKAQWQETLFHLEGSYLVFSQTDAEIDVAIVQTEANATIWILTGVAGVVMITLMAILILRRKAHWPHLPQPWPAEFYLCPEGLQGERPWGFLHRGQYISGDFSGSRQFPEALPSLHRHRQHQRR